jgi:hypothetical protein
MAIEWIAVSVSLVIDSTVYAQSEGIGYRTWGFTCNECEHVNYSLIEAQNMGNHI